MKKENDPAVTVNTLQMAALVAIKHKRCLLLTFLVSAAVTGVHTSSLPKQYAACTVIMPPMEGLADSSSIASKLSLADSGLLRNAMSISGIADVYEGILKSRVVMDAVVEECYADADADADVTMKPEMRRRLARSTRIRVSEEGFLSITVIDSSPTRAANAANAFVRELDVQNKRMSVGQAFSKRTFLETRLKEIEEKLANIDELSARDARIQESIFEMVTREYEIAKIAEAKSMPTIQILDTALVPAECLPRKIAQKTLMMAVAAFVFVWGLLFLRGILVECGEHSMDRPPNAGEGEKLPKTEAGIVEIEKRRLVTSSMRKPSVRPCNTNSIHH